MESKDQDILPILDSLLQSFRSLSSEVGSLKQICHLFEALGNVAREYLRSPTIDHEGRDKSDTLTTTGGPIAVANQSAGLQEDLIMRHGHGQYEDVGLQPAHPGHETTASIIEHWSNINPATWMDNMSDLEDWALNNAESGMLWE